MLTPIAALLAVGVLVAMVVSGHLRENKQFVRFAPAGVMPESPDEIDRIEVTTSAGRREYVRANDGWRAGPAGPFAPRSLASHLNDSIKFMHVSAPVRVMERTEWSSLGLREFGLDPPRLRVVVNRSGASRFAISFGATNVLGLSHYARREGDREIALLPGFVAEAWEHVGKAP